MAWQDFWQKNSSLFISSLLLSKNEFNLWCNLSNVVYFYFRVFLEIPSTIQALFLRKFFENTHISFAFCLWSRRGYLFIYSVKKKKMFSIVIYGKSCHFIDYHMIWSLSQPHQILSLQIKNKLKWLCGGSCL